MTQPKTRRDLAREALAATSAALTHLRALAWAVESLASALRSEDGSDELLALAGELRANRSAANAALIDAQEAVDRMLDAAGRLPRGLVKPPEEPPR
jgi:hypothetical protein